MGIVTSQMTGGYPAEADIGQFLTDRGLELVTENLVNYIADHKQFVWGLLNAIDWAMALGVYCPSPTTFNVRDGKYQFKGQVKTYSAGSAVDPTDNDTTYVWLKPDNTIGSDIDGNGWPNTEHIKLAEIDVDGSGNITDIRDLRGETFFNYSSKKAIEAHTSDDTLTAVESGSVHSNLGATGLGARSRL